VSDTKTEAELVPRVQDGDLSDFEELSHLHGSRLRAFVAMKLPIPHLIDEIAHEAFAPPQTRPDRRADRNFLEKELPVSNISKIIVLGKWQRP
jgi:DNA-directed RNA polymerase specialized sigma24 family protein